ncbi:5-carboxymethyl-2-hydroxymuconate isomerase [Nitratireductor thuwali]|uniref:5-carboxymethyl-2-hydroxymuconate Delta-isomerase n=1 Tax=Nitratireductor thuwali TaxID=2267699 RepID=A0ABY5MN09_9HYPH|nr:5-carboxymethyl-2-hydroxymuconate Delta-isomerase [Nitratireductor thuwali]
MPHIQIEYSANLEQTVDISGLCEEIRATAVAIDIFVMAGVRVRAMRADHCAIADGDPKHGFVDISIRLRGGRPAVQRQDATQRIFDAARAFLEPAMARHSIALSLEMRDIDPELSPKAGTIRDHLEA